MSKNIPGYVSLTVHELGIIEYVAGEEAPRHKFKGQQQGGGKNHNSRRGGQQRRGGMGGRPDMSLSNADPRPFRIPRANYRPDAAPQQDAPVSAPTSAVVPPTTES